MRVPAVVQTNPGENAIAVIATMLSYYGRIIPLAEMREGNVTSRGGSTPEQVRDMATAYGLDTEIVAADIDELRKMKFPLVVRWKKQYYAVVTGISGNRISISDPARGEYPLSVDTFAKNYTGTALVMRPGKDFKRGGHRVSMYELISGRMDGVRRQLVYLAILNAVAVILNLVMIRFTREMMDMADGNYSGFSIIDDLADSSFGDQNAYRTLVVSMCVILVLSTLANIFKTLNIYSTSYEVAATSGTDLFRTILYQPMRFFEEYRTGEIIQRLEDNATLDLSLVRTIIPRALDFVMTLVYLVLMLLYQWQIALLCVAIEIIYLAISMQLRNRIKMQARANASSTGAMNTSLLNGLDTIDTIKSGGLERMFYSEWSKTQVEYDASRMSNNDINATTGVIDDLHSLLSQAVLLFAGAYFMISGNFTFGTMAALQAVLVSFRNAFSNCINMANALQKTRTDIELIEDMRCRETVPEIPLSPDDEPDKLKGEITVSHLSYRYDTGEPFAIEDINFEVKQGELVAIVGASGCGKSTLLKCLLSLYPVTEGEIRYAGRLRSEIPDVVFHSTVGAVDQECVVFEDSIADNITMWDRTIENYEMILAARDAHIYDRIMQEGEDFYGQMLENGRNFSGGELQRIELARALASEPTLLLLDEFTSALDAVTEAEVFESIKAKDTTCIIVAHRLSTVSSCDRILVMDHGRIVQEGTHEELYNSEGLYRQLLMVPEDNN